MNLEVNIAYFYIIGLLQSEEHVYRIWRLMLVRIEAFDGYGIRDDYQNKQAAMIRCIPVYRETCCIGITGPHLSCL